MKRPALIIVLTLGAWLATSAPYIAGWVNQPRGGLYLATNPASSADTPAYYSNIEQARQGRLVFANQFTSEPQKPSFFHPVWLIGGWVAMIFSLSPIIAFHLLRLVSIIVFIVALERLTRSWFSNQRDHVVALLLVLTSSGLGWTMMQKIFEGRAVLGRSIDLWVDEANTFRSMTHSALFVISQLLVLGSLWLMYRRTTGANSRWPWLGGAGLAILGIIHPYDIVTVLAVTVVWYVFWCLSDRSRGRRWSVGRTFIGWWAWLLPVMMYYYVFPWQQVGVRGWFMQNLNLSPTPWAVLLGFGFLLPLAAAGAIISWRDSRRPTALLVCWVATVLIMLYLPGITIQRRFLSGLHVPLALLSAFAIVWIIGQIRSRAAYGLVAAGILALLSITNASRQVADVKTMISPSRADYPVYLDANNNQAFIWLKAHSQLDDVVLANFWNSNTMAGLIARPQVFAHPNQTVRSWDRERDWKTIVDGATNSAERSTILQKLGVKWLYWSSQDAARNSYQPAEDTIWLRAYQNTGVTIFELQVNRS